MNDSVDPPRADAVEDTSEWIRRCSERMMALNPVLAHGALSSISEDMSRRSHWRQMAPETAAEEAFDPPATRQPRTADDSAGIRVADQL